MARIRYAVSRNDTINVVLDNGDTYALRWPGREEEMHAMADAINRGLRVRSTGLDAGDDWARLRARVMAKQAAEMASGVRADTGRREPAAKPNLFDRLVHWWLAIP